MIHTKTGVVISSSCHAVQLLRRTVNLNDDVKPKTHTVQVPMLHTSFLATSESEIVTT